jgi:hypothetical protein
LPDRYPRTAKAQWRKEKHAKKYDEEFDTGNIDLQENILSHGPVFPLRPLRAFAPLR